MIGRGPVRTCAVLLAGAFMLPAPSPAARAQTGADADAVTVFGFQDERITESSGLVDLGRLMVTTNDSGSGPRLFVLDAGTGATVGTSDYGAEVVDVEALAPAGGRNVWVADIGDNRRTRGSVAVHLARVGRGPLEQPATTYRLRYPDGPHDAESLFADRRGRLHVITKSFGGGEVFRASARLRRDRANRLERVGRVAEYATDAALLPGGGHLLVRGPGAASVYDLPSLRPVGSFALPPQPQGEAVSVGPGGRIRLSSEGVGAAVLQVSLPPAIARLVVAARTTRGPAAASPSPSAQGAGSADSRRDEDRRPGAVVTQPWVPWVVPGVLVVGALGIWLGLRRRTK